MKNPSIILASASPRRAQILTQVGIPFKVIPSHADENVQGIIDAQVKELSLRKAKAVFDGFSVEKQEHIIIAADTLVAIDGQILGKPTSPDHACHMLQTLSNRTHQVFTGVTIYKNKVAHTFHEITDVTFRLLSEDEISAYVATGEPMDKAGAYGIQEKGALLVDYINGDYYTVMGLPIAKICMSLASFGFHPWASS